MRSAAQYARNIMIFKDPESTLTHLIIYKSISRALWQQNMKLGRRLVASHRLARHYLEIDELAGVLRLRHPVEFQMAANVAQCNMAEKKQAALRSQLNADDPAVVQKKTRRRLRGLAKRARL
eukprot:9492679-Pyramimonas_sp.AAC.1